MEISTLLVRPSPKYDESLYGYIARVMKENQYSLSLFNKLINFDDKRLRFRKYDIFVMEYENIRKLSILFGIEVEILEKMNYSLIVGRKKQLIRENQVFVHYLSTEKLRICTSCLKEYGYLRKVWDLYGYTACHIHKQLLISTCPSCNTDILIGTRFDMKCTHCNYSLLESEPTKTDSVIVPELIYSKLHSEMIDVTSENPLTRLRLNGLNGVLFLIINSFSENISNKASISLKKNILTLNKELNKVFMVFENFPQNYFSLLDEMRQKRRQLKLSNSVGMTRDFGEFARSIYSQFSSEEFNFLREGFEKFLDIHITEYITSNFKKTEFFSQKYITGYQALKLLGIKLHVIRELLNNGILNGYYEPKNRLYNTVLDRTKVIEFKENMIKGINNLSKIIGLSRRDTLLLLKERVIIPISDKIKINNSYIYSKKDLGVLYQKIENHMYLREEINIKKLISFLSAKNAFLKQGISTVEFINALISGEIIPYISINETVGFNRYYFKYEELYSYIKNTKKIIIDGVFINKRKHKKVERYLGDRSKVRNEDVDHK